MRFDATPAEAPVGLVCTEGHSVLGRLSPVLDGVSLRDVFDTRAVVMHSVPFSLRGAFRGVLKVSLQAIIKGHEQQSDLRIMRVGSSSCYSPVCCCSDLGEEEESTKKHCENDSTSCRKEDGWKCWL